MTRRYFVEDVNVLTKELVENKQVLVHYLDWTEGTLYPQNRGGGNRYVTPKASEWMGWGRAVWDVSGKYYEFMNIRGPSPPGDL